MLEFYPQIKSVHVYAVLASGSLFFLRGLLVQAVLLTAALMLLTILPSAIYANGWLATKLGLLVVYIALGTFALRRGRTRQVRAACFVAAVAVFISMYFIARTHDPLGPLKLLTS